MKNVFVVKIIVLSMVACMIMSGCSNTDTQTNLSVGDTPSADPLPEPSSEIQSSTLHSPDIEISTDMTDNSLVGYWADIYRGTDDIDHLNGFYFAEDGTGFIFHSSEGAFLITSYSYSDNGLLVCFLNMDEEPAEWFFQIRSLSENELILMHDANDGDVARTYNRMLKIESLDCLGGYTVTQTDGQVIDIMGYYTTLILNDGSASELELIDEEYPPIEKTIAISADKPEFKFVQRLIEPFEDQDEFFSEYGAAIIEVYKVGSTDELIDTIKIDRISPIAWGMFFIVDINFDGYKDIVIVIDRQGNQGMDVYECYTWNNETMKFHGASFPDWGFVSIDTERQMLLAAWRNWASSYGWAIWEYIDGTLMKTHECNQDYLHTSDDGNANIHINEVQLINGEMQVISDGNVTEDELDALFYYDDLWQLGSESWISVCGVNEIEEE